MQVGFSTGAVARGDIDRGVEIAERFETTLVELSSLSERELPQLEVAVRTNRAARFARVSLHGPVKHRVLPELELIDRLGHLSRLGFEVVMHPDVFEVPERWAALGRSLLVENNDSRKTAGRTPEELDEYFAAAPDAGFCLDVSHALDVGGRELALDLAGRYADRLVQLHAGCACGRPEGTRLSSELCAAAADVCAVVGRDLPVVLERTTPEDDVDALRSQLDAIRRLS